MSNNFRAGLAVFAAVCLGGAVAGYKRFLSGTGLQISVVEQIMKEIKYQMFNACILFAEGVKKNVLSKLPNDQAKREKIKETIKDDVLQLFEEKQRLILLKYNVKKEDFEKIVSNPEKYGKQLSQLERQIEDLMLDAIAGKLPDFTVQEELKRDFPLEKTFVLFRQMLIHMTNHMLAAFRKELENPDFDPNDEEDYFRTIRSVHVYQVKEKFFDEKGFHHVDKNITFAKLMEQYKRKDREFLQKTKDMEKIYDSIIQNVVQVAPKLTPQEVRERYETFRHSREDMKQIEDIPEIPGMKWQASVGTQRLADWVHSNPEIISDMMRGKPPKVEFDNSHLTKSEAREMMGAEHARDGKMFNFSKKNEPELADIEPPEVKKDFSKKHAQEVVEVAAVPAPVVEEPVVEAPVQPVEQPQIHIKQPEALPVTASNPEVSPNEKLANDNRAQDQPQEAN